jgi:hypothetical protein
MVRNILAMAALLAGGCNSGSGDGRAGANANATPATAPAPPLAANAATANAIAPAAAPAPAPAAGTAEIGRCHMDECSWSIIESRTPVRSDAAGSLYLLSVLGGTSTHPGGDYPDDSRHVRIVWNAAPHEVFVFCSRRLPAVILPDRGRLQVDALDFVTGPFGYQEGSASLYVRICHPGDDWASNGFAARFGYQAREEAPDISLERPEDIFRFAR